MRYDLIDSSLFSRNRHRLRELLKPNSIVILHSNDLLPSNADGKMPFKQNSDLIHLSGIDQEGSILLLFPDAHTKTQREILFLTETNEHIAIWEGAKLSKQQATEISEIQNVQWNSNFEQISHGLINQAEHIYLYTNEHQRADATIQTKNDRFIEQIKLSYPLHKLERLAPLMHELRPIKQETEVELIRKACEITRDGFMRVLRCVKPDVGEWEIEAEYIHEFTRQRSKGFAYSPIIASGENNNVLHYLENDQICRSGDLLLMDVAAEYANWNSDMTRTIPVNGKFTPRQREVYISVLSVMRYANSILRPGILLSDYQAKVLECMEEELIKLKLIDPSESKKQPSSKPLVKKYFMHGTSHHLGLDVHDVSLANSAVSVANVFTIEPGIYIPEENMGIRLENNVYIGTHENRDLMHDIPIEPDDIEAEMAR